VVQDAIKCFSHYPANLMDIVRRTDPSTVTQHGLYVRELTHDHISSPIQPHIPNDASQQTKHNAATSGQDTVHAEKNPTHDQLNQAPCQGHQQPQPELAPHTPEESSACRATHTAADRGQSIISNSTSVSQVAAQRSAEPGVFLKAGERKDNSNKGDAQTLEQASSQKATEGPQEAAAIAGLDAQTPLQAQSTGSVSQLMGSLGQSKGGLGQAKRGVSCAEGKGCQPEDNVRPESRGVWGRGRVTLLGDSAHATVPSGQCFYCS